MAKATGVRKLKEYVREANTIIDHIAQFQTEFDEGDIYDCLTDAMMKLQDAVSLIRDEIRAR